jgi:hypothetical protein
MVDARFLAPLIQPRSHPATTAQKGLGTSCFVIPLRMDARNVFEA